MKKVVKGNTINFYEGDTEIMYLDHSTDECIWFFNTDSVITITEDMELFSYLNELMNQSYEFNNELLENYKDDNYLVWYSDCYYNPDDEWSLASVSCLHIKREEDSIKVWCTKKLDEMINRSNKSYGICFSPAGNGKYSKNIITNRTLQDDFVIYVYRQLLSNNKVLKLT